MPLTAACPSCAARLTAPDRLAGKTVKCPKCRTTFTLPTPEPGFEVVEDDEPVVARPKVKPPEASGFTIVEDEIPERPKPKKLPKKRILIDDEDEKYTVPRRRTSSGSAASHTRLFIALGGGLVLLAVIAGGVYYALGKVQTKPTTAATTPEPATPPAPVEWKTFTAPDKTFSVRLPGTPTPANDGDLAGVKTQNWQLKSGDWEYKFTVVTLPPELPGESMLDTMVETLSTGAKPDPGVTYTDTKLGKYPARQVRFVTGTEHLYLRAATAGGRLFIFVVSSKTPSTEAADEVKKYFDSVTIQ
jgi:hypothetical protein